jgi:hypothetical protein
MRSKDDRKLSKNSLRKSYSSQTIKLTYNTSLKNCVSKKLGNKDSPSKNENESALKEIV